MCTVQLHNFRLTSVPVISGSSKSTRTSDDDSVHDGHLFARNQLLHQNNLLTTVLYSDSLPECIHRMLTKINVY